MAKTEINIPKRCVRSWHNYVQTVGEVITEESMTIPDDSFSIQEILERFTKGIPLNVERKGEYSDSNDFEDVDQRSMIKDYADIEEAVFDIKSKKRGKSEKTILDNKLDERAGDKNPLSEVEAPLVGK